VLTKIINMCNIVLTHYSVIEKSVDGEKLIISYY